MTIKPDYEKSADFLECWCTGQWVLTAIHPDQTKIETDTFDNRKDLLAWLVVLGKDHNIYFEVNPPNRHLTKKALRTDIKEVCWLHVDVDPRQGEDLAAEQTRIRELFDTDLPKGVPEPTCLIFSGGGYQAFWKLDEPLPITGDLEAAEEAALYNLQLEITFEADPCHNIDRIMRLPGTINRPNARKREKGRVQALASLTIWEPDRTYDLDKFTKAPPTDAAQPARGRHKINVTDNVTRLRSVDELPSEVPDLCKVVIVQGMDPDNPGKWPSRSEPLFWVCCELARAGCKDDMIFSVITDPGFAISSSVLDKGSRVKGYAMHQIERARDQAVDPSLRELNDRYAVILDIGGKCRILCEGFDPVLKRRTISYQSFQDFTNAHSNRSVNWSANGKPHSMPLGKWWSNHPHRRQYQNVVFAPEIDVPEAFNLWSGFRYDARPGNCDKFLDHLKKNLCIGHAPWYNYLLDWMSMAVQRPGRPGHVAIVLRGGRGTGKSFFAHIFGSLFGNHFLAVSKTKHVTGAFNAHLQDCIVLFSDEAFAAEDRKSEGTLKTLVTEDMLVVEPKGVDAHMSMNFLHLILASNATWAIPAGHDERRFFVLDVGERHKQDTKYFRAIKRQMDAGGYEALLHLLLSRDVSRFEVRNVPVTDALERQKILSLSPKDEWWFGKLLAGQIVEGRDWPEYIFASELAHDFAIHLKLWTRRLDETSNATSLGMFLSALDERIKRKQVTGRHTVIQQDGSTRVVNRPSAYTLPTLKQCRGVWEKKMNNKIDWPGDMEASTEEDKGVF